jgi:conjugal transfer pilus assembly protein TraB
MSKFQDTIDEWKELEPKKKVFLAVLALAGVVFIVVHHFVNENSSSSGQEVNTSSPSSASGNEVSLPNAQDRQHLDVLPKTNRNQGLEEMNTRLDQLESLIRRSPGYDGQSKSPPAVSVPSGTATVSLDKPLDPGKVDFNEAPKSPPQGSDSSTISKDGNNSAVSSMPAPRPPPSEMKVWESENKVSQLPAPVVPRIVIPVNSALEGVMLSGVNARQPGAVTGAAGSSVSALNVGAPFVTKLKGNAILPNGWKLSELGDCFLGGSAVAILSTERANAIAETISCIDTNGEIWEAPVKAYALDVDGTLGIAGKVVSKQGSILMQSALAGMASGLGAALSPQALPSFNGSAMGGQQQGYMIPNTSMLAGSALGQGVNTAAAQLSTFYLQYAREIFPVVEVVAGTRVTWILKESIELKKTNTKDAMK